MHITTPLTDQAVLGSHLSTPVQSCLHQWLDPAESPLVRQTASLSVVQRSCQQQQQQQWQRRWQQQTQAATPTFAITAGHCPAAQPLNKHTAEFECAFQSRVCSASAATITTSCLQVSPDMFLLTQLPLDPLNRTLNHQHTASQKLWKLWTVKLWTTNRLLTRV